MRKAVTLIELIFSIVIIALTFTVIPKIIVATTKSSIQSRKEDAMMNAIALIKIATFVAWDENNTKSDTILKTVHNVYECNQVTTQRVGGFDGSRNCNDDNNYTSSSLGKDELNETIDDVDDFIGKVNSYFLSYCDNDFVDDYIMEVNVTYVNDPELSSSNVKLNKVQTDISNSKYLTVKVRYNPDGTKANVEKGNGCIANFYYHTFNLGYVELNGEPWH